MNSDIISSTVFGLEEGDLDNLTQPVVIKIKHQVSWIPIQNNTIFGRFIAWYIIIYVFCFHISFNAFRNGWITVRPVVTFWIHHLGQYILNVG